MLPASPGRNLTSLARRPPRRLCILPVTLFLRAFLACQRTQRGRMKRLETVTFGTDGGRVVFFFSLLVRGPGRYSCTRSFPVEAPNAKTFGSARPAVL